MKKPRPSAIAPNLLDPDQLSARLYKQVGFLLTQLETGKHITLRERIAALIAVGRLQQMFAALRKALPEDERSGSTVKKYAAAFAPADATGRRAKNARAEPDDWFEHAERATESDGDESDEYAN